MVKNGLNILLATKDAKKLDLYAYFYQKRVYIEKTLMKLNICFFIKDDELLEEDNKIWEKSLKYHQKTFW